MHQMTIDSEEIVQIALEAYHTTHGEQDITQFELHLRRMLMRKRPSESQKNYTYKICPPNLMGTWENNQQLLKG